MTTRYRRCMRAKPYPGGPGKRPTATAGRGARLDSASMRWLDHGHGNPPGRHPGHRRRDARRSSWSGSLIAAAILLRHRAGQDPRDHGPIPFGYAKSLTEKAKKGGPFAFAGDTRRHGFWIAMEDGELVALKIRKPGREGLQRGAGAGSVDTLRGLQRRPDPDRRARPLPDRGPEEGRPARASCSWT